MSFYCFSLGERPEEEARFTSPINPSQNKSLCQCRNFRTASITTSPDAAAAAMFTELSLLLAKWRAEEDEIIGVYTECRFPASDRYLAFL